MFDSLLLLQSQSLRVNATMASLFVEKIASFFLNRCLNKQSPTDIYRLSQQNDASKCGDNLLQLSNIAYMSAPQFPSSIPA